MASYPNDQGNPASAIPVWIASGPTATTLGYQQIPNINASSALTVPSGATRITFVVTGGNARWRDDGVAPTASVGMPVLANVPYAYGANLSAIQFIGQTASVALNVSYYA